MAEPQADKVVELARATRISVTEVRRYQRAGVLIVESESTLSERELRRVRRVRRLRRDLGLDLESIGIIVRLVEQIEDLQRK